MRYSLGSSTYWCSSSASARAEVRSCPNGFSTTTRPVRVRPASTGRHFHSLKVEAERQIVVAALERNEWHITRTAEELGLADHASLLKIMRRLDLKKQ